MLKVTIVIPVLNEEKNIEILTNKIFKVLKNYVFEIIFVDDNSFDSSEKILNKLKKKISNFDFIIRRNEQRDLFQSCVLGVKKSKYKYILIMDGDLQHNPKYIPIMIKRLFLKKADIVVGARDFKENNNNSLTLLRLTSSKIIRFFIFILFGKKTMDPLSGYFLFKKEIFIKNKNNFYGAGFKILSDIIYNVNNLLIFDVIIKFDRRRFGNSKMNLKIFMQIIYFFIFCFFRKVFNVYFRIK